MFHSATIRLTLWYLALVLLISLTFSAVLYRLATHELGNRLRHQSAQFVGFMPRRLPPQAVEAELQVGAHNIMIQLFIFNGIVVVVAGGAGYFLARRTLQPIEAAHVAQKRFTADASHELRTPLAAMRTEIEVALRDESLSQAAARDLLKSNLEEVKKLESLSTALIELAQYEENGSPPNEPCHVRAIVREAIDHVAKSAAKRHITIHEQTAELVIPGNPIALRQLLIILLDNAIKYSPPQTTVSVEASEYSHHAILSVQDQGKGIDEADLPHVFERFYRADPSRSTIVGFGLGLPLAQLIVKQHQGTITIKSVPSKGTVVTVSLPLRS